MVGVTGIEPATPASRRQCSTSLSYTPINVDVEWQKAPNPLKPLYKWNLAEYAAR